MTDVGQGFASSKNMDAEEAAHKLYDDAVDDLGKHDADLGILLSSTNFDVDELVSQLGEKMFETVDDWVGGTTSGEIFNSESTLGGAVLVLLDLDDTKIDVSISRNVHEEPKDSGKKAVNGATDDEFHESDKNKLIFTIMSGLTLEEPGVEFKVLKGISDEIGSGVPVVGGSAGDDGKFEENYQIFNGGVYKNSVITVSFLSDMEIITGKEHGFNNKVESGVISSTEGRVIQEINGTPADEFYADAIGIEKEKLHETFEAPTGAELSKAMKFALEYGLAEELSTGELRLMTPVQATEDGGLFMTVEVEESSLIHIVEGDEDSLVNAGKEAFINRDEDLEPIFSMVADCTCRNMALSEESLSKETSRLHEFLDCPVAGFYSYGEIGGKESFCTFQNQTVSGFLFAK